MISRLRIRHGFLALIIPALLVGSPPVAATDVTCPADPAQAVLSAENSELDFTGVVANELLNAVALHANLAYLAQQYRQAGVGHSRVLLSWKNIQSAQSPAFVAEKFDWGFTDLQVSAIAGAGIRTLGIIDETPQWASTCAGKPYFYLCSAANIADYENFVRALVLRYGPAGTNQIRDWEIRIENATAASPAQSKEEYVAELNMAFVTIKSEDPDAKVWGPEVAFVPDTAQNVRAHDWVTYVIANGHFDVFSIHLFPNMAVGFADFAFATTASVRSELDSSALEAIPLAVTAMAVLPPAPPAAPFTGPEQAAHLTDMYACAWAGGASHAMWFAGTQWDGYVPEIPCDTAYGIFRYVNVVNPVSPFTWTCAPAAPSPPNPNKIVPRYSYWTLQALGSIVAGPLPPGSPYGILGASSNPCKPNGSGQCSPLLYWYSTGIAQPNVLLLGPGVTTPCRASNREHSAQITLSSGAPATYSLYAADSSCAPTGSPLAQLVVSAAMN